MDFWNHVLDNPLYHIPRFSLWFALMMTVLSLEALLINSYRNLRHQGKPGRQAHEARACTGVRMITYSVATFAYGLTAGCLYHHVGGQPALALGIGLIAHAIFAIGVLARYDEIPLIDSVLMFLASLTLAVHVFTMLMLPPFVPTFDGLQSAMLWCVELVLAMMIIHAFTKVVRQGIPEVRRMIAEGKEFLRNGQ